MVDFAHLVKLALAGSILFLVVGLGMRATFAEATSLFRHLFQAPHSLLRAIIAMNFVVPIVAATIARVFALPFPIKVAIVAMSISPVPPILPGKQLKFGGRASFVYGLLVAVSLVAILFVPLSVELLGSLFHRDYYIGFADIAFVIGKTILVPLAVGIMVRSFAPDFADRWAPRILQLGNILLITGLLPVIIATWHGMVSLIGDGTIFAILAVVAMAIAAGHWMGGPNDHDRTALGIVSAMRHPGVALAIATRNAPDEKLIPAAIILFALVAVITTTIYGKFRIRSGMSV